MIFDSRIYDLWPIYENIKKFYPLGLTDDRKFYFDYPGMKSLEKILSERIHDNDSFEAEWKLIEKKIAALTNKPVTGTTYGQDPCFSAYIELDQISIGNLTRFKEIHFFVSIVGPFYSIIGVDRNEIIIDDERVVSYNYLVVSPEKEFAEDFLIINKAIFQKFPTYKMVPFGILNQEIQGLKILHRDEHEKNYIFHALFNDQIDLKVSVVGQQGYGSEQWFRDDYDPKIQSGWTVYPPETFMQLLKNITPKELAPGLTGYYAHGEQLTLGLIEIKAGSVLPQHHHVHEQITYILEGQLDMTIGGKFCSLTAGMYYVIPSNVPHGATAITDCKVIDVFNPVREDYRS